MATASPKNLPNTLAASLRSTLPHLLPARADLKADMMLDIDIHRSAWLIMPIWRRCCHLGCGADQLLDAGDLDGSHPVVLAATAKGRTFERLVDQTAIGLIDCMASGIRKGDTPETNPLSALLAEWIEERLASPMAQAAHHDLCPTCGQARPQQAVA
jgi:hypothetical protein